jgi:hypothetical protein
MTLRTDIRLACVSLCIGAIWFLLALGWARVVGFAFLVYPAYVAVRVVREMRPPADGNEP